MARTPGEIERNVMNWVLLPAFSVLHRRTNVFDAPDIPPSFADRGGWCRIAHAVL
jgi:hypothetical protein